MNDEFMWFFSKEFFLGEEILLLIICTDRFNIGKFKCIKLEKVTMNKSF